MKSHVITIKKRRFALIAGIVAGLLAPVAVSSGSVHAAGASASSSKYYLAGKSSPVKGIKVSGWEGQRVYAAITTDQRMSVWVTVSTTTDLTLAFGYKAFTGDEIAFTGTQEAVNAALASLTITVPDTQSISAVKVKTTFFKDSEGLAYNPQNQHFYRFVPERISGTDAFTAAAARQEFGLTGYLASITSADENDFISAKIQGAKNVWIGASDSVKEGEWKWVGGPDDGKQFWSGNCTKVDGKLVDGFFAKWATSEPNNWISAATKKADGTKVNPNAEDNNCGGLDYDPTTTKLGEDCVVTNWDVTGVVATEKVGYWNDVPCSLKTNWDGTPIGGYVVEFGTKTEGSTYDSNVDIKEHTMVKYVPAQKMPTFIDVLFNIFSSSQKTLKKGIKIKVLKPKTKTQPAQTVTCPATFAKMRFSYTLLFQEAGRYSFYFTDAKGKRIPMECGSKIKDRVITQAISAPVIQTVKDGEKPVITAYLKASAVWANPGPDYPMLNVILKRKDGTLIRIDQPNPPLAGMPIR